MKTIRVVAAVIQKDGQVFATQRGYGDFKDGWEFPGGKVEEGETSKEALIREIREELDISISIEKYLCTVEHDYPTFHLTMHCFLCSIVEGALILHEHEAAKWLNKDHLWSVEWLPADVDVVKVLDNDLEMSSAPLLTSD
ncbi:MAG: (deoxy)nucleoside triphosphate pyrophosphohydrolase [Clostridia bacterium]|nr:(deoxy)nucleoside triphosphate pyrophosphohydrolase [Clostridia bacterium]